MNKFINPRIIVSLMSNKSSRGRLRQFLHIVGCLAFFTFFSNTLFGQITVTVPASICLTCSATGTLNCGSAAYSGTYAAGVAFDGTQTVDIGIAVTNPGDYSIATDVQNGYGFVATGTFAGGETTVTLTAVGTPLTSGTDTFTLTFGTDSCTFDVSVAACPVLGETPVLIKL